MIPHFNKTLPYSLQKTQYIGIIWVLLMGALTHPQGLFAQDPVKIFIYAGQSNAQGRSDLISRIRTGDNDSDILFSWRIQGGNNWLQVGWDVLQPVPSLNSNTNAIYAGELATMRNIYDAGLEDIGLIKIANSGTNLRRHWNSTYPRTPNPVSNGNGGSYWMMIDLVESKLAELDAMGIPYEIEALFWHQGEADTRNTMALLYETNLQNFADSIKVHLSPDIELYVASIYNPSRDPADVALVRQAQETVAANNSHVHFVDLDTIYYDENGVKNDMYITNDGIHYKDPGYFKVGDSFSFAYLQQNPVVPCDPILDPNLFSQITITPADETDCGANDGSINLSGNLSGLIFSINGGQSFQATSSFTDLPPGNYSLLVQDDQQLACSVPYPNNPILIGSPQGPSINSVVPTATSDCEAQDGMLVVNATGNNLAYSLDKSSFQPDNQFLTLAAGSYTVYVRDASLPTCLDSASVVVEVPDTCGPGECTVPYNLALDQPSSQSSVNQDGVASFTNDGNTTGNDFEGGDANLSHTLFGDSQPWWKVDLGSSSTLDRVHVYNRNSTNSNHLARLKNFYLYFSESDMDGERSHSSLKSDAAIGWVYFSGEVGTDETISLNDLQARHVMIKLVGNGPLHIAEFEVYGCPGEGGPSDPCEGQPNVSIDAAGPFTTDQGIQQLSGNPTGGTWSNSANADGTFDPSQGAGNYTVTYTVDFGNGCIKSTDATIEVSEPIDPCLGQPDVTINPAGPFTTDQGIQQLSGNPTGGTWSNSANADGTFDPSQGAGNYTVTYTVDFGNGCIKSIDASIEVIEGTDPCEGLGPVIITPAGPFTDSQPLQTLLGSPSGGTWGGAANVDGTFDPSQGTGSYEVTYTVDFGDGCILEDTETIVVNPTTDPCAGQPDVTIDPAGPFTTDQGIQQLTGNPIGGTWSNSANTDGTFDPSQGAGSYTVTYTYDFGNGCIKSTDATIEVNEPADPCAGQLDVTIDPAGPFTTDQGIQQLTGNPIGGTWSSSANADGTFDPSQGAGSYTVTYTYDFGNGCIKSANASITVTDPPSGECTVPYNLALNQPSSQSSTNAEGVASFTNDGNTVGDDFSGADANLSHTIFGDNQPWWKVDLGSESSLDRAVLYNRNTSNANHLRRLKNFYLYFSAGDMDGERSHSSLKNDGSIAWVYFSGELGTDETIQLNDILARHVMIKLVGNGPLHIAEFELYGCPGEGGPTDPCLGQPDVAIVPAGPFTTDQGIQQLSANPSGGSWSGDANSNGTFDPSQGEGTYTVTYTVDFGNGCIKSANASITVSAPGDPCAGQPDVMINPAGPFTTDQGIQQLSATPSGGTWSGAANTNGTFDPSQGAGSYTVTYTVDFGDGCLKSDDLSVTVTDPPTGECSVPYNMALNQPSSQSSTNAEGVASFANDGNPVGDDFSGADANLSHTAFGDNQPWWKVDLGTAAILDRAVLYNRNTSNSKHLARLKNFYLYFSDSDLDGERSHSSLKNDADIEWVYFSGELGTDETIQLNDIEARHVMIKLVGNGPLHIAELEVYGCPDGPSNTRYAETNEISERRIQAKYPQIFLIPNPTDGQKGVKVILDVPASEFVVLELYNAEGKLLQRENHEGTINYTKFNLSLKGLPQGIYLVRSTGNGWDLTKRLVLK